MLGIKEVVVKNDYSLYIKFNNGVNGNIDLLDTLKNDHREIIKELLDREKFKTAKIWFHTISWDNGVDFAPEFLYEQMKIQKNLII